MDKPEARTALGGYVRRRRERLGMTIDEAAAKGPMSPVTWSRVELARNVRRLTYSTVDRVLGWREGASLDFLDDGIEPGPANDQSSMDRPGEAQEATPADEAQESDVVDEGVRKAMELMAEGQRLMAEGHRVLAELRKAREERRETG